MTVASTTRRNDYDGNNTTASYAFSFKIFAASHLQVVVRNDTTLVETTLTLTTHYTVPTSSVNNASGGTISLVAGAFDWLNGSNYLKTGYSMTIRRVPPLTQFTDIRSQGSYFPETHEDQFDLFMHILQYHQDEIDRAVRIQVTAGSSTVTIPGAQDGYVLGWDNDELTNIDLNAAIQSVASSALASAVASATASATASAAAALVSENNAETAETNAETAETNAEAAQVAAEAAQAAAEAAAAGVLANPMTTTGDIIVGGASGTPTRLASPSDATRFLDGSGAYDTVKDSDLSLSDVTDNDVSTTKHGFVPKAPNDPTKFLRGDGTFAVPGGSGGLVAVQVFTASGTYTRTAGVTKAIVELVGGGGGSDTDTAGCGGGGGGGYAKKYITPGTTETVTIGAGGSAGDIGNGGGAAAGAGGTTSFGSHCSATGGSAGSRGGGAGGAGGAGSSGDINISGQKGGNSDATWSGAGGSTMLGPGGANILAGAGVAGANYGGGASGGQSSSGAAGASGIIIVYEYA